MKRLYTLSTILLTTLVANSTLGQTGPKVRFTGGARSIISNADIQVNDTIPDKTTAKKAVAGYALVDLGFNISPNKNTEILGMIRINNKYGGFYGAGVAFDVRQLWVKGIIADVVRYQLGDINLKQTPFTLYNHNEDQLIGQPAVFQLQRDIVNYETFYKSNTWRQQGLSLDWGLQFNKFVKELNVNTYLTRQNATNFGNIQDRLFGGTTIDLMQSDHLSIAYNLAALFDVKGTALDTNVFSNIVNTMTFRYNQKLGKLNAKLQGEFGNSRYHYSIDTTAPTLTDYFMNPTFSVSPESKQWEAELGYLNVGPDFRSPGAQSKRVDYNAQSNFFNRYKQTQMDRPLNYGDITGNSLLYRTGINPKLMAYNPLINNVLPYGQATFNRQGLYLKGKFNSRNEKIQSEFSHHQLKEIRGQGTAALKSFMMTRLQMGANLGKYLHWDREVKLSASACYQSTQRTGKFAFESVDLKSFQTGIGAEFEILPSLDFMIGYTALQGKGNDLLSDRNAFTEVIDFSKYNVNLNQTVTAAGIRFRFGEKAYLAGLYQQSNYQDKMHSFNNYKINQWMVVYNMTF
jgi:hypothetical protein